MKKWRQFFQSVFIRHIVGPDPLPPIDSIYQPMLGPDLLRFVASQHLQFAKENEKLVVEYSEYQAIMMEELRVDGCEVTLQVNEHGALCYMITADQTGKIAN
jgi:hypothetical protein